MAASDAKLQTLENNYGQARKTLIAAGEAYDLAVKEAKTQYAHARRSGTAPPPAVVAEIQRSPGSKAHTLYHVYRGYYRADWMAACAALDAHRGMLRQGAAPAPEAERPRGQGGKPAVQDAAYDLKASWGQPQAAGATLPTHQGAARLGAPRPPPRQLAAHCRCAPFSALLSASMYLIALDGAGSAMGQDADREPLLGSSPPDERGAVAAAAAHVTPPAQLQRKTGAALVALGWSHTKQD
jgi:hypothetical protein